MSTSYATEPRDIVPELDRIIHETVAFLRADPVFGRVFDGTASRELYIRYLTQTYHYVKLTQVMLGEGAKALKDHPDPERRAFGERFAHHELEEVGHEQWVLNDLRALGVDPAEVERAEPGPAVKAYLSMSAFIWTSRHPVALMGISTLLEGVSEQLGSSTARAFKERSKIPNIAGALSFVEAHGEADVGHMDEARAAIRRVTPPADQDAILLVARMTAFYYTHLLSP